MWRCFPTAESGLSRRPPGSERPLFRRAAEILALALVLLGSAAPAGAAGPDAAARVDPLSERIVCPCGCGDKIVAKCYCGVADGLRAEILGQVEAGSTDDQVIEYFVAKYGERILAAPAAHGFNWAAWIVPAGVLLLGTGLALWLLRRWSRSSRAAATAAPRRAAAAEPQDAFTRQLDAELASRKD